MATNKISLMEAYMIETLRSNGVTDADIITQAEKNNVSEWETINPNFDFNKLIALYAKDPALFKSVIHDGYQVKFVTFNGLKNLLKFKLGFQEEQDYQLTETGLTDLEVNEGQLMTIKQVLSPNWIVTELQPESYNKKIKIELA